MQLSDRVTGAVLIALGGAAAVFGARLPAVPGQDVGPAAFPMLIGGGLALCGGLIAFGIGHSFEVPEEGDDPAPPGSLHLGPLHLGRLRPLIPTALLFFYVLAVERLGFLPTAAVVVLLAAIALGARLRLAIPLAIIAPLCVHLAFYKLLRVPLPAGILPAPW